MKTSRDRRVLQYHRWGWFGIPLSVGGGLVQLTGLCAKSAANVCEILANGTIYDFGVCDEGGITISRRPNKRPSREKAPGPSNASATAEMIIPNAISLTSCRNQAGAGNHERAIPRKHIPITSPASGVRNPAASDTPPMIRTTPSIDFSEEEPDGPEK